MSKVMELKAEIFDLLAQMEQYQYAIQQLEQMKQGKLKELQEEMQKPVEITNEE